MGVPSKRLLRKFSFQTAILASLLDKQSIRMLRPYDISVVDWRIISRLHEGGPSSMNSMLPTLIVNQALISRRVSVLVRKGLVSIAPDPENGRQKVIAITTKGQRMYRAIVPVSDARQDLLESALSAKEVEAYFSIVVKLKVRLQHDLANQPKN